ncbi:MAG: hypothetical protein M1830_006484, partial [Pleopsidium flavum]
MDATEESYAKALHRLLPLLAQLRRLEDAHEDLHQDYVTAQLHLEIYDILIPIAALSKRRNPMLGQQLRGRKRDISTNLETDDRLPGGEFRSTTCTTQEASPAYDEDSPSLGP